MQQLSNATFKNLRVPRAHLIAAVKEEHKLDICVVIHDFLPALKVVLIAREAVDEETELLLIFLHGVFHRLAAHVKRQEICKKYAVVYFTVIVQVV